MKDSKTVIITGAAKGIGRATALRFAQDGYRVALVDKDEKSLQELHAFIEQQYGDNTSWDKGRGVVNKGEAVSLVICGNLAEEQFLEKIVDETLAQWGSIDVLVNNAAWRTIESMRSISMETWDKTIRVCLTAPAFLSKGCAEVMERNASGGVIINVSSMMSDRPAGTSPAYIASKGALESLTKELAIAYGRSGIRVIAVKPGFIDTGMSKDYKDPAGEELSDQLAEYLVDATPLKGPGSPSNIADAIAWLSSDQSAFITGTSITVDGGFTTNMNSYLLKKKQFPNEY
jgi:NAD(P)-dependent dehydrogenase (short-subunit alcohol dehydrogenase family)